MNRKKCTKCKFFQPVQSFHKKKGGKFGVDSVCKHCTSLAKKEQFRAKQIKRRAKKVRRVTYTKELKVDPYFVDIGSKQAGDALNILLQSINSNLIRL